MGGVYAANTVGAIIGSVVSGLVLVVWLGSHTAQQVLIVMSALSALMLLAPWRRGTAAAAASNGGR